MARWQRAAAAGRTGRGAAGAGTTGEARLPKAPSALSDRAGRAASASTAVAVPRRSAALHAAECEGLSPAAHVAALAPPPCADRGRRASQTPRTQDVIRTQLWRATFQSDFPRLSMPSRVLRFEFWYVTGSVFEFRQLSSVKLVPQIHLTFICSQLGSSEQCEGLENLAFYDVSV